MARWVGAERGRLPKLEVVMLLPKPDPKNLENGWSDGREVQRLLEEKLHKKACKDAKNASKRAKKAEGFAKKVRSRRPAVLRRLHAIDATRVHLTMKWVVSFWILRPFGPRRATAMLRAGEADGVRREPLLLLDYCRGCL